MQNQERWKKVAEGLRINISTEQLKKISPFLEAWHKASHEALDRDLSLVEPVTVFRPGAK